MKSGEVGEYSLPYKPFCSSCTRDVMLLEITFDNTGSKEEINSHYST
jgi:hypothetical protein